MSLGWQRQRCLATTIVYCFRCPFSGYLGAGLHTKRLLDQVVYCYALQSWKALDGVQEQYPLTIRSTRRRKGERDGVLDKSIELAISCGMTIPLR